ncbi:LysR family transcriptional regulator [Streptacidiphilus jiangxiensis]|uniref:DNA-binding transcriptional regulator, LysR family n=1 Tax=Streptacidiphilus jiangxiensis TaxID=235985 RepID=A0A1H7TTP3_STRJI|nr:LysR family transcriptional regulator [Streptacidiphilus jiangxiensis]SEL88232.1 DNA-binding transcriptional regulator, LysR family [Streptacidiphilus jiangxiensis]
MLSTRRLGLLKDLAQTGTIAGAAQLAGCTPSAASQQLAALEQELGVALLERSSRSVRLTEAGRVLVEHAHRVFTELDAAEAAARAVSGLRGGRIRVAAFNSVATGLVVPALMAFRQRHRDVRMTFTEAEPELSMPAVANGDLDLAVTHEYGRLPQPDLRGLRQVLLHRDELLLAVPPHLQRAGQTSASLRDYAEATWLSALPSSGFQAATELLCRAEGFEPDIAFRSDQYDLLLLMVAADFGVALVPALAAEPRRGVTYLHVSRPTGLTHDIHVTTREADTSPAVEALTALLVQRGVGGTRRPGDRPGGSRG